MTPSWSRMRWRTWSRSWPWLGPSWGSLTSLLFFLLSLLLWITFWWSFLSLWYRRLRFRSFWDITVKKEDFILIILLRILNGFFCHCRRTREVDTAPNQDPNRYQDNLRFLKGNIQFCTQSYHTYLFEVGSWTTVSFGFTEGSGSGVASFFSGAGVALRLLVLWWGEREWLRFRSLLRGDDRLRGEGDLDLRLGERSAT